MIRCNRNDTMQSLQQQSTKELNRLAAKRSSSTSSSCPGFPNSGAATAATAAAADDDDDEAPAPETKLAVNVQRSPKLTAGTITC
jgi:uncharacterized protein (DUF2147 family)